jgi:hypothetical protein
MFEIFQPNRGEKATIEGGAEGTLANTDVAQVKLFSAVLPAEFEA